MNTRLSESVQSLVARRRPFFHGLAGAFALALARPTDATNIAALLIVLAGAALRIWATAHIRKNAELCTTGPYSVVRHPLYLANFIIMVGVCLAANNLVVIATALPAMAALYTVVVRHEEASLSQRFGQAWIEYAARVPAFIPCRLGPIPRITLARRAFRWQRALFEVVLLCLLVALFELKEEVFERILFITYQPFWASAVASVRLGLFP